jgi:hypothetical protein
MDQVKLQFRPEFLNRSQPPLLFPHLTSCSLSGMSLPATLKAKMLLKPPPDGASTRTPSRCSEAECCVVVVVRAAAQGVALQHARRWRPSSSEYDTMHPP